MPIEHDPEASPATETEIPADTSAADVASPPSGADDTTEQPRSMLDVLKDAVAPAETAEAEAPSAEPDKESGADAKSDDEKPETVAVEDLSADELAKLPFHKHPRFKELVTNAKAAKAQAAEHAAEIERLAEPARNFASIQTFMANNGLVEDEVVDLFKIGALVKNDPEKALEALFPIMVDLRKRSGHELPKDLSDQVEEGRITEEAARELSVIRARAARLEAAGAQHREREAEQTQSRAAEDQAAAFQAATQDWVNEVKVKDPDFGRKEQLIADRTVRLVSAEGKPATPEAALAIVKRAYKEVSDELRAALPPKQERKREAGSTSSQEPTAVPTSLKDSLRLALRGAA